MTLRRFSVYVPDNTGGFTPDQVYLCSEVDQLLGEARELLTVICRPWKVWSLHEYHEWLERRNAFLKATEPKP